MKKFFQYLDNYWSSFKDHLNSLGDGEKWFYGIVAAIIITIIPTLIARKGRNASKGKVNSSPGKEPLPIPVSGVVSIRDYNKLYKETIGLKQEIERLKNQATDAAQKRLLEDAEHKAQTETPTDVRELLVEALEEEEFAHQELFLLELRYLVFLTFYEKGTAFSEEEKNQGHRLLVDMARALKEHPQNENLWFLKGNTFYFLLHYKKAIACYEKALAIKEGLHEACYNMGECV